MEDVKVEIIDGVVYHNGWNVLAVMETWFGQGNVPWEYLPKKK